MITLGVGLGLAAAMAPFLWYYQLWGRHSTPIRDWNELFRMNLFNLNEYIAPVTLVLAAAALVGWRWKKLDHAERSLVALAVAVLVALSLWVPTVAPEGFLRYVIKRYCNKIYIPKKTPK